MVYGLGERLKGERKKCCLSQKKVAEIVGVNPSSISYYEKGEANPSLEVLIKLAALYKCSTDYLLMGKETISPKIPLESSFKKGSSKDVKSYHKL